MNDFNAVYSSYRNEVNAALDGFFSETQPAVNASMRYSIEAGGKRIRPVLALATCELCGTDRHKAMLFACALEIIHTYSLIYDDLPCMDNDTLRRGKPTNHVVFGEDVALLAGMGLYARAFEIILNNYTEYGLTMSQVIDAQKVLLHASGIGGIVMGQYLDIENVAGNSAVNNEYVLNVHKLKTSAMLEASVMVGAIAADADEQKKQALLEYAECIGLAFQIRDDILDVIGDKENMGKSIGKDKIDKKVTFVDIMGLQKAQAELVRISEKGKKALFVFGDKADFLLKLADMLCTRIN